LDVMMAGTSSEQELAFGPFRLDAANARLLRDGRPVAITPKALDVLHYLACRPDRLVTKEELLSALWPDVIVTDASIKVCVREVRKALDDGAKTPTYIETVHRRGYRFIARVETGDTTPAADVRQSAAPQPPAAAPRRALVGRDRELAGLGESFAAACAGQRQCAFVRGGPGSGKTALVETLMAQVAAAGGEPPLVLAGHCFQQFGTSEPYMPVWEAVGRLARERSSPVLQALVARHAAAYAQSADANASEPRAGSERLLRELADGVEALSAEAPVLLLLEDVHWADYSTIDLLSALARRRAPARLKVVATYRPAEVADAEHPLAEVVQGLVVAGAAREVELDFLGEEAVAQFLAGRFPGARFPRALARRLHQRTDGHPLFLVHLVSDLVEQGVIVETAGGWSVASADGASDAPGDGAQGAWAAVLDTQVPQTVRAMIEAQLARLPAGARAALEAAAVAGVECSAAAVAAALAADVVYAEQACEDLSRRYHFLEPRGIAEWPDGTAATHYRFVHELYHRVVYEQVPVARRARMHQLVGLTVESAWDGRAAEEAANLAMHFETGRDWHRAVKYLRLAARAATRQYAHREAASYLSRALEAVDRLPEGARAEHELDVLKSLAVNLQVTRGFAAPEVEAVHARAYALCRPGGGASRADIARTFPVLWGIWLFHKVRSDLRKALPMCDQLLAAARDSGDAALLLQAHQAVCVTHLCCGLPEMTWDHMGQAAAIYDPRLHSENTEVFGQDPGVATQAFGGVALWLMGRPREALAAAQRALELARRLDQPSSLAVAMHFNGMLHQCRGDAAETARWAQATLELAAEEGFSFWLAGGTVFNGWAKVAAAPRGAAADVEAGLADIRRGLDMWLATGSRTYHTYYLGLLGDALLRAGDTAAALRTLDEALAAARALPEGLYEAELHRLRGHCFANDGDDALACFTRALDVARAQGARQFEWRAADELAALLRRRGLAGEADDVLASTTRNADIAPENPASDDFHAALRRRPAR
jgi:DNA-binding winged helix-turn-helix (wHTH) protein/tetratricopeptide (TPR) repeat protein